MDVLGWDIGGAHIKMARTVGGRVAAVRVEPCPLWQGLSHLEAALDRGLAALPPPDRHAVTMTGELTDLFADRAEGVRAILGALRKRFDPAVVSVYAVDGGFLSADEAGQQPERVASANWHATATLAARRLGDALLVDIGSTTTDFVPLRRGAVAARAADDATRLAAEELVYTGVVRTPIMALAETLPFAGARVGVMAEYFATVSDAYRLIGTLPESADLHPAADGRGKSIAESRARLARMIGRDVRSASDAAWADLAHAVVGLQLRRLESAAERVLSGIDLPPTAPLVGAGVGRFLLTELSRRLRRSYRDFASLIEAPTALAAAAADAAPAVAVALLADA